MSQLLQIATRPKPTRTFLSWGDTLDVISAFDGTSKSVAEAQGIVFTEAGTGEYTFDANGMIPPPNSNSDYAYASYPDTFLASADLYTKGFTFRCMTEKESLDLSIDSSPFTLFRVSLQGGLGSVFQAAGVDYYEPQNSVVAAALLHVQVLYEEFDDLVEETYSFDPTRGTFGTYDWYLNRCLVMTVELASEWIVSADILLGGLGGFLNFGTPTYYMSDIMLAVGPVDLTTATNLKYIATGGDSIINNGQYQTGYDQVDNNPPIAAPFGPDGYGGYTTVGFPSAQPFPQNYYNFNIFPWLHYYLSLKGITPADTSNGPNQIWSGSQNGAYIDPGESNTLEGRINALLQLPGDYPQGPTPGTVDYFFTNMGNNDYRAQPSTDPQVLETWADNLLSIYIGELDRLIDNSPNIELIGCITPSPAYVSIASSVEVNPESRTAWFDAMVNSQLDGYRRVCKVIDVTTDWQREYTNVIEPSVPYEDAIHLTKLGDKYMASKMAEALPDFS